MDALTDGLSVDGDELVCKSPYLFTALWPIVLEACYLVACMSICVNAVLLVELRMMLRYCS